MTGIGETSPKRLTVRAYPLLNKDKLRTELSLICETFSEPLGLLNILITTPMTTTEAQRRRSTLKRVKALLSNTRVPGHLNTLAMLSVERTLIRNMPDFNQRVINHFSRLEKHFKSFPSEINIFAAYIIVQRCSQSLRVSVCLNS